MFLTILNTQSAHNKTMRAKAGNQAVLVGLISNFLLAVLKTGFGIIGHSPALLADGINSTSDFAYYIVVRIFVRMANKPADDEHPYGHSQLETIGALVVGSFVITTAVAIFWNSIDTMYTLFIGEGGFKGGTQITLWIALFTVALKIILTRYTQKVGKDTQNASIIALAYDHRNDIFSAAAAVIGIFLGRQGYYWVDPFAGALVAFVILNTGIQILRESTLDLMDTIPGKPLKTQVYKLVSEIEQVLHIDEVQAHRFGPYLMMNITICVDSEITVRKGDEIATSVEQTLKGNIDFLRTVHIHYHPLVDQHIEEQGNEIDL